MDNKSELEKLNVHRYSGKESARITKECIKTAFIYFLKTKDPDEISITELTKKAGVSRAAFYRHFGSKTDIVMDIHETLLTEINGFLEVALSCDDLATFLVKLFEEIKNRQDEYGLLLKAAHFGNAHISESRFIENNYSEITLEERYMFIGWYRGIQAIITSWFKNGMKESPPKMAQICLDLFGEKYPIKK